MKHIKLILLAALLLSTMGLSAQDLSNFNGMRSKGNIPDDISRTLDELYSLDKQRVRDYNDGKLTNRDNVLRASYQLGNLMVSGRILYGDPLTQMVNRIADTLLADYPDLRNELRFYVVKSSEVNAFATGQGIIFVNLGMIAQVEDEAQLAYVISHEIVHYYKKHNLEIITRKRTSSDKNVKVEDESLRHFLKYHSRSHEMENEADSLGLVMFYLNSDYDKNVADGFFDVLQYAYLPFDEVPFDTNSFNTPYFHVLPGSFLNEVSPITARDDYDDSKSTHPNLLKRREKTSAVLAEYRGGRHFVTTTKDEFHKLQSLARFECVRQKLIEGDDIEAYYDVVLLQREFADNPFLAKAKAQAMYNLSRKASYDSVDTKPFGDYKEMEGEIQQLYYFFKNVHKDELNILAVREVWKAGQMFPNDAKLSRMLDDLLTDLSVKYNYTPSSFASVYDTAAPEVETTDTAATSNKYSRIKKKKQTAVSRSNNYFAFVDIIEKDPAFRERLNSALRHNESAGKKSYNYTPSSNLLSYSPTYLVFDDASGDLKIQETDDNERRVAANSSAVAARMGMNAIDFSYHGLRDAGHAEGSGDFYNEYVALNEWCEEFASSYEKYGKCFFVQEQMDSLIRKYDANTLQMVLVANIENTHSDASAVKAFSALVYFCPRLISQIYKLIADNQKSYVFAATIDAENGRLLQTDQVSVHRRDDASLVKGLQYDNLRQTRLQYDTTYNPLCKAPGLMGRRLGITAGVDVGLPFTMQAINALWYVGRLIVDDGSDIDFMPVFRPSVGLEYAMGRKWGLAFAADFNSSDLKMSNAKCHTGFPEDTIRDRTWTFALTARHYKTEAAAPWGSYFGFGLMMSHINLFGLGELKLDHPYMHNVFGARIECGRNLIFWDRLIVNVGMQYGVTFGFPWPKNEAVLLGASVSEDAPMVNFASVMSSNMWNQNFLTLNLRLGFLPF